MIGISVTLAAASFPDAATKLYFNKARSEIQSLKKSAVDSTDTVYALATLIEHIRKLSFPASLKNDVRELIYTLEKTKFRLVMKDRYEEARLYFEKASRIFERIERNYDGKSKKEPTAELVNDFNIASVVAKEITIKMSSLMIKDDSDINSKKEPIPERIRQFMRIVGKLPVEKQFKSLLTSLYEKCMTTIRMLEKDELKLAKLAWWEVRDIFHSLYEAHVHKTLW